MEEKQRGVKRVHAEWFSEDVEPFPQSVADVERSQYKAAWLEAMKSEVDGHKTTGPRHRRESGNL